MAGEWAVGGDFKRILCALAKKHPSRIVEEPDVAADVATMRDACEGLGTDEEAIIDVLANKTFEQIEGGRVRVEKRIGRLDTAAGKAPWFHTVR